jgi:CO/xanthine dehydrogenase Mo-binding subunit
MRRREFLRAAASAGGALLLGVSFAGCANPALKRMREAADETGSFQPNAFLTIRPDGEVWVAVGKSEMGQGVFTSHAMLVAEELEVALERVKPFHADAGDDFQKLGMQMTGGSTSLSDSYVPMREAAASAREMLIGAAAARWGVARGTCKALAGEVVHEASGRRLGYGELAKEAAAQPIPESVEIKSVGEFKVLGKEAPRVDLLPKVTGAPIFGMDVAVEGLLKACVVRPPVLGAPVESFEAEVARGMPGVVAIFAFDRGVAVVAERYWQAQRAAREVRVKWGAHRLERFSTDALREAAASRVTRAGVSIRDDGDVDAAIGAAGARALDVTYTGPYLAHAPLEPMNAAAWVREGRVDIWAPIQWQSAAQADVATLLGVDRQDVHVHTTYLGGGFGRRLMIDYVIEAVLVSREVGRPVHVIWTREDDMRGGYYRPLQHSRMRGAVGEDGMPQAVHYHVMSQSLLDLRDWLPGLLPEWMPRLTRAMMGRAVGHVVDTDSLPNVLATEGASDATYKIPSWRVEYTQIRADVSVNFWRSVGHSFNAFAVEGFIDELAHLGGKDPAELRRTLLKDDLRKMSVLERVIEASGWGTPLEPGWGRGIAVHRSFGTDCAQVIEAGVFDGEIKVRRVVCAVNCGIVVNPDIVRAQIEGGIIQGLSAAIWQKIDIKDGVVVQDNFDSYRMMRLHETPRIEVEIIKSVAPPSGVGEPGLPPVAPALAGALFMATGRRLRSMPFVDALKEVSP